MWTPDILVQQHVFTDETKNHLRCNSKLWRRWNANLVGSWSEIWVAVVFGFETPLHIIQSDGDSAAIASENKLFFGVASSLGSSPSGGTSTGGGSGLYSGVEHWIGGFCRFEATSNLTEAKSSGQYRFDFPFWHGKIVNGDLSISATPSGVVASETWMTPLLLRFLKGSPNWTINSMIWDSSGQTPPFTTWTKSAIKSWMANAANWAALYSARPSGTIEGTAWQTPVDEDLNGHFDTLAISHNMSFLKMRISAVYGKKAA